MASRRHHFCVGKSLGFGPHYVSSSQSWITVGLKLVFLKSQLNMSLYGIFPSDLRLKKNSFPQWIYLTLVHSYFTLPRPQKGNAQPSPSLIYPDLVSDNKSRLKVLPDLFLGGSAPSMQSFQLKFIHSRKYRHHFCLGIFPYLVYTPETMAMFLSPLKPSG